MSVSLFLSHSHPPIPSSALDSQFLSHVLWPLPIYIHPEASFQDRARTESFPHHHCLRHPVAPPWSITLPQFFFYPTCPIPTVPLAWLHMNWTYTAPVLLTAPWLAPPPCLDDSSCLSVSYTENHRMSALQDMVTSLYLLLSLGMICNNHLHQEILKRFIIRVGNIKQ